MNKLKFTAQQWHDRIMWPLKSEDSLELIAKLAALCSETESY
jgi:hypothetical protein